MNDLGISHRQECLSSSDPLCCNLRALRDCYVEFCQPGFPICLGQSVIQSFPLMFVGKDYLIRTPAGAKSGRGEGGSYSVTVGTKALIDLTFRFSEKLGQGRKQVELLHQTGQKSLLLMSSSVNE